MSEEPLAPFAEPLELPPPPPERDPFWGYSDLALFVGLAFPCLLLSLGVVKGAMALFHVSDQSGAVEAVVGQLVFYVLLFLALRMMFLAQYDRPLWQSLGWKAMRLPILTIVMLGVATAILVALTSALLHTPDTPNQITEMMRDRGSLILLAVFGVTIAPLCEELSFRGFLQPLLVRSVGAVAGVVLTSSVFGFLHFHEYGNSWRHAVMISLAGIAFGAVRHMTGSTKASTLMHAAYNALLFVGVFSQRKDLPHLW